MQMPAGCAMDAIHHRTAHPHTSPPLHNSPTPWSLSPWCSLAFQPDERPRAHRVIFPPEGTFWQSTIYVSHI